MASCIPGYEYDIFISYRQKDNRYDGWVTEFVFSLRKELEVTFKEEISVYFDENPHDGILEGHEVDDTVQSKLKCLIFIPILSQTYCDPASFAWTREFLAFKEIAGTDRFGLKVRLPNGNISSRILPVRIHELDVHDTRLLEEELGGPIRPIDFIYSAPGVNRPLRIREDLPQQNQNRTNYRDQVNKIANLAKQIITSLKSPRSEKSELRPEGTAERRPVKVGRKRKIAFVTLLGMAALISAYFLTWRISLSRDEGISPATIAVLPFKIIGEDEKSAYLADGIQEAVRANLCMFQELRVKSRTSVERYRNESKSVPEIANELNVMYVLEGTAQRVGDQIRVTVQLIDARSDVHMWSETFDRKLEDVFVMQSQISEVIAKALKARLTPDIAERLHKMPTESFEVYELFLRAQQAGRRFSQSRRVDDLNLAIALLEEAIWKDPQFALGYGWLAGLRMIKEGDRLFEPKVSNSIVSLANRALEFDSTVVEAHLALSELYYLLHDDLNALRSTYRALKDESLDGASVVVLMKRLGMVYSRAGALDNAEFIFDELLKWDPSDEEVLYEKMIVLAAGRKTVQLEALKAELRNSHNDRALMDVINLHLALEKQQGKEVVVIYDRQSRLGDIQSELFSPYLLIFAQALKSEGRGEEASKLVSLSEESLGDSPFFRAQALLVKGQTDEGLDLLSGERVGWYNLTLSQVNPVFVPVSQTSEFTGFVSSNTMRLRDLQSQIEQLEKKGQLATPMSIMNAIRVRGGLGT